MERNSFNLNKTLLANAKKISILSFSRFCPRAKYLLKVDDDVFIQLPRLYHLLGSLDRSPLHGNRPIVLGNVASGWKPVRNLESKYYISPKQFDETRYPPFVTGPSYVVSKKAINGIVPFKLTIRICP